jgi:hypothetical protein
MTTRLIPEVGCWYRSRRGSLFQVVALDEHLGTIETQDSDGDIDEIEFDAWFALGVQPVAAPEDPIGPTDPKEPEDREYALAGEGWEPTLPRAIDDLADGIDAREAERADVIGDVEEPLH